MIPDTICQIPETHSQLPHILHAVSQWVKYAGIGLSALFSIYSLRQETWDTHKKNFTPHGARLARLLVFSGTLALSGAIVEDKANEKLQDEASKHGNETFKQELCKANTELTMKLATEIRETNRTITKNLEPRFKNIIKQQQKGTEQSVEQINNATTTLQARLGDLVPLSELKTTIELKDFSLKQLRFEPESAKGPSRFYRAHDVGVATETEFARIVCSGAGEQHPWELDIPITTGIYLVAGMTQQNGRLKDNCEFPGYTKLLNSGQMSKTSPVRTCDSSARDVLLGWSTKRNDLPLELAWFLNRQALQVEMNDRMEDMLHLNVKMEVGLKVTAVPNTIVVNLTAKSTGGPAQYISRTYTLLKEPHGGDPENAIFTFLYDLEKPTSQPEKRTDETGVFLADIRCLKSRIN
jgi:hypothetical protein